MAVATAERKKFVVRENRTVILMVPDSRGVGQRVVRRAGREVDLTKEEAEYFVKGGYVAPVTTGS